MRPQPDLTLAFHNSLKDHTVPTHLEGGLLLVEWIFLFLPFFFLIIYSHFLEEVLSLLLFVQSIILSSN